jgi:glycine hydroxymethyltransferase
MDNIMVTTVEAMNALAQADPQTTKLLESGYGAAAEAIDMTVASGPVLSSPVLAALGSPLHHRCHIGVAGTREYMSAPGTEDLEVLATQRVLDLFGGDFATVQPLSGTIANNAVWNAALKRGDLVLIWGHEDGMHFSADFRNGAVTRDLRSATYGVDPETGYLDIESIADLADRLRPTLIVLGWSAYSRSIDFARIRAIADRAGSLLHVDMTQFAGLVAADLYPNPVPFADFVTASVRPTLDGPNSGILIAREGWKSRIANAISPGLQGGQSQNIVAALAVCLGQAQDEPFRARQRATVRNARALAAALARGSIRIVSGGTDVHQVLVDTRDLGFDRFEAEHRLAQVAIWAQGLWSNRSESFHPALRFSTKAVTARKFTPKDMEAVGRIVVSALDHDADQAELDSLRTECEQLAKSHPLPFAYM